MARLPVRSVLFVGLAAWGALSASAQLPMVREAEACEVRCEAGREAAGNLWARDRKTTPDFWGRAAGDAVTWPVTLKLAHRDMRFGLRYSYAGASFEAHFPHNPKRVLHLIVDDGPPIPLRVPATGSWEEFRTVAVDLPRLTAGAHTFRVVSPDAHMVTNLDSLILFKGPEETLPVLLRGTTVATSPSKRFVIRATPDAPFALPPDRIFAEFERIHAHYSDFMGWAPTDPIPINLMQDDRWPNPGATAFQNAGGVFFRASAMATEQGNWLHEMTHMFYVAHFPGWLDEPSVRVLTTMAWAPALYPNGTNLAANSAEERARAEGAAVLARPGETRDALEPILNALIVRYGTDVFRRFFHACVKAGAKGEMDFRPGRWMTKAEVVRYMSAAAGEDVTPLFQRWRGFEAAAP